MIISENKEPTIDDFSNLCHAAEAKLNSWAESSKKDFKNSNGKKLEPIVLEALDLCARGTAFDGTLSLVSGQRFPDIVANKLFGVEVKSTKEDQWKVIGGSVAEGTRVETVENIFLMFGKLHDPIGFRTRRYQDCLYDIAVTHSPRYKIDMELPKGQTIFDKIGLDYDVLRKEDNPLDYVVSYYSSTLKPGERLWWVSGRDVEDKAVSPKIMIWDSVSYEHRKNLIAQSIVFFPEIFGKSQDKFSKVALWLTSEYCIVSPNLRDNFTAGGKVDISVSNVVYERLPQLFKKVVDNVSYIKNLLQNTDEFLLKRYWEDGYNGYVSAEENWINLISQKADAKTAALVKNMMEHSDELKIL